MAAFLTVGAWASGGHDDHHAKTEEHHAKAEDHHAKAEDHHAKAEEHHAKAEEHHAHEGPGFWERLAKNSILARLFQSTHAKLEHAAHLDSENEELKMRISRLEIEVANLRDQNSHHHELARAEHLKHEAKHEGGVETARTIASLKTADPELLSRPPKKVFDEALKRFNSEDYETAAKALVFLADNEENDSFQTAQTFYLTGVSLYKMGNYKTALGYFARAEKAAHDADLSYAPRALGWMALCYKKLGDRKAESATVDKLIHDFPKSKEARRLNGNA